MGLLATLTGISLLGKIIRLIVLVVLVIVVYLAVTLVQVWLTGRHYDPRPAQAIVVMGAAQYNGLPAFWEQEPSISNALVQVPDGATISGQRCCRSGTENASGYETSSRRRVLCRSSWGVRYHRLDGPTLVLSPEWCGMSIATNEHEYRIRCKGPFLLPNHPLVRQTWISSCSDPSRDWHSCAR